LFSKIISNRATAAFTYNLFQEYYTDENILIEHILIAALPRGKKQVGRIKRIPVLIKLAPQQKA